MVSTFDLRLQQVVLKLYLHDDKDKQRALKRVTGISGVDSVSMDMKEKKLTVTGDVDPMICSGGFEGNRDKEGERKGTSDIVQ
ncbi:Heavy metal-associated isoprenylated plant protein 39 [Linum perenne]